jgi:hypothetical protein
MARTCAAQCARSADFRKGEKGSLPVTLTTGVRLGPYEIVSALRYSSDGKSVDPGAPVPLFATRAGGAAISVNKQTYVVSKDGQRFLMSVVEETASPIAVILNWKGKP